MINAINNTFRIALKNRNKIPEISITDKENAMRIYCNVTLQMN